jgi:hypothetical protein
MIAPSSGSQSEELRHLPQVQSVTQTGATRFRKTSALSELVSRASDAKMIAMRRSSGLRHALRDIALLAVILAPTLSACVSSVSAELEADEQNARLAREKLWTALQSGNKEAVDADSRAYSLAREKLSYDRGIPTAGEFRDFERLGW